LTGQSDCAQGESTKDNTLISDLTKSATWHCNEEKEKRIPPLMTPRSHLLPSSPIHVLKTIAGGSKRAKERRSGTERRRRPRRIIRESRRDERRGRHVDIVIVLRKLCMGMTGRIVARVIMFVFVNLDAIVDVAHYTVLDIVIEEIMACVVVAVMVAATGIRIAAGHVVAVMTVTVARVQCTVLLLW
jgi:hypothetical protein